MREKYHIKEDKKAFLYPKEWTNFYKLLSERQQPYFKIATNTGGRITEIQHLTPNDINEERSQLTFRITKVKAKLKEKRPTPRTILISKDFKMWLLRYIKKYGIKRNDSIVTYTLPAVNRIIKKNLKAIGVLNWKDFSSHSMRRTHGNWLKALAIADSEIAGRCGHDINTMVKHYVSPTLFNSEDRILITDILGEDLIKNLKGG